MGDYSNFHRIAEGGSRTLTLLPGRDFESRASANSATSALRGHIIAALKIIVKQNFHSAFRKSGSGSQTAVSSICNTRNNKLFLIDFYLSNRLTYRGAELIFTVG